jgi:uncharacterized protein (TIGR02145 family)
MDFAVYIWSDDSTICTEASKCLLSTTDRIIYANFTDSATTGSGDTINFDLNVISGNNVAIDTHDVYVEYTKQRASFMQQFSTAKCSSMLEYPLASSELNLMDSRDGKIYKIRKLADHNCWMVDNLALDGSQTIDSTTSDVATYTLPATTTPNAIAYCADLDTADWANKCGNHYDWGVATAASTITSSNAVGSICPKNWRLPTSAEYTSLRSNYGGWNTGAQVISSDWRGLYSGQNGSAGGGGAYWSSSTSSSYSLGLTYSSSAGYTVNIGSNLTRSEKYSVRCLAR